MGIFGLSFSRSKSGDASLLGDFGKAQNTAYGDYASGGVLTNEGLAGLRSLDSTYQQRLTDPLGAVGRGIFARARGQLSTDAQRRQGIFSSRIAQQALQSGGTMSPEAQAELEANNQRSINESLFSSENDLANQEASMTLNETGKLFDRMEGIRKTIVGVGQDERTRSLQSIISMLSARTGRTGSVSGGVSVSSRELKEDIAQLDTSDALDALEAMQPVVYTYKHNGERHAGFIAEDVPELVAMSGRKTLHALDFAAVLASVVKSQQATIEAMQQRIDALERGN